MTIDRRHYNLQTLTYKEAFIELERCSWSQFDGELVAKFKLLIDDLELPSSEKWAEDEFLMDKLMGHVFN